MPTFNGTAGNDTITGTADDDLIRGLGGDDRLAGGGGNDRLDGGTGIDVMRGGAGDDSYYVDTAGDLAIELVGEGTDLVYASVSYRLREHVENLTLTGTAVRAIGNAYANRLVGNESNNVLDGQAGVDTMRGGAGDDIYYVDDTRDLAVEAAGEGTDIVYSSATYRLREYVENLTLTGTAVRGIGNSGANRIVGNASNNILDGQAGADVMRGRGGNDSYYVDNIGDRAIENAGEGTDTVYSAIDFVLGANIENLNLTGSDSIDATGNALDNRLVGNAGDNFLDGGTGADTMRGGLGHDSYYIDNAGDRAIENAGEGSDTVYSSIGFTLGANLENLTLTGAEAIDGSGNSLDNFLTGNAADNVLGGGGGNDVLNGLAGQDTLEGGDGDDTLDGGEGNDFLHGDGGNDSLEGGSGNDILDGLDGDDVLVGGAGADMLSGGGGADIFRFLSASDSILNNADFIAGFEAGIDILDLSQIDADATLDGNQAFFWASGPSGAGSLWYESLGDGNFAFYADLDGDNIVDFTLSMFGPNFFPEDIIL